MLLGILVASLLGNMLTEKVILRAGYGTKKVKGVVRAGYGSKNVWFCLILLLILTYKCIIRMNLDLMEFIPEIICLKNTNEDAYVINLDEYAVLVAILLPCICLIIILFILIALKLSMPRRKSDILLEIKTCKRIKNTSK